MLISPKKTKLIWRQEHSERKGMSDHLFFSEMSVHSRIELEFKNGGEGKTREPGEKHLGEE